MAEAPALDFPTLDRSQVSKQAMHASIDMHPSVISGECRWLL